MMIWIIVVICFACIFSGKAERVYLKDACVWESFEASCHERQVLLVRKASFGRLRSGRCFNLTSDEKPCFADVQSFVERHCGGRRDCKIKLTNENLKLFPGNCSLYKQKSLEIEYSCEAVYAVQDQTCVSNQTLLVTTNSGYLANIVTDETEQGSQSCPWRFQPRPGQTVHLTLLDFGVWIDRADRDRRNICRIYATIKEIETAHQKSDTLVCGGVEREKFIMSTDTEITIAVMRQENTVNDTAYFFIKYQVFDCPSYEAPDLAITERSGSGIRISCQFNRDLVWEIKCTAGNWLPRYNINCPEMTTPAPVPSPSGLPCPEISPRDGTSLNRTADGGYVVSCSEGPSVELICIKGAWSSSQTSACLDSPATSAATSDQQLTMIVIAGAAAVVALVVVVAIASTVACRKRRRAKKKMNCSIRSHMNNSYYSGNCQLLPGPSAERARSEIYDTLDESRMQDVNEPPPLPSTSNCNQGTSRCAKTLQANQKLEPWTNASMERRCGTLPVHRPLPEPHEYTTPFKRDSTYLMPREPVYLNPVPIDDTVKAKV